MRTAVSSTKRISWKTVFTDKRLFPSWSKKAPENYPLLAAASHSGRYRRHSSFLRKNRGHIRVFADIGCAIACGAPTTINAKRVLGKESKVFAVDIVDLEQLGPETKQKLGRGKVTPLAHSISKEPLPFKCDAIRFANVSYYMTQSDRRKALVNIWRSLKNGGYLLGAEVKLSRGSYQFVLRKKGRGFEIIQAP